MRKSKKKCPLCSIDGVYIDWCIKSCIETRFSGCSSQEFARFTVLTCYGYNSEYVAMGNPKTLTPGRSTDPHYGLYLAGIWIENIGGVFGILDYLDSPSHQSVL